MPWAALLRFGGVERRETGTHLVDWTYDAEGNSTESRSYFGVVGQVTKYLYTSAINASWPTAVVYPDSADVFTQDPTSRVWTLVTDEGDRVSTVYDRLGRTTATTDQRGVVHEYTFDSAGRRSADTVASLGSSGIVDGSIRRIGTTYDDVGRVQAVTSYSDTAGTTVVNQVEYGYNGWGKVHHEYQEHNGAVDGSTPFVQYDYVDGATGGVAKYVRPHQVTYPNGREVQYGYGAAGAIDDVLSRLASVSASSGTLATFKYLGAGRIVEEDHSDIDVKLSYLDGSGNVTGLDRFGRVADQVWTDYGEDPDVALDHFTYTYDRAGNRTSRDNELHSAFDEDYTYDALDRLTDADRADSFDQSWGLDGLGNFATFDDDGAAQTRTANGANEITGITGGWITPAYDRAGNLVSGPKPGAETSQAHYIYDGWNRLVEVRADDSGQSGALIAQYAYDGANRRIEKWLPAAPPSETHYYYNREWQLLEERSVDDQGTLLASNQYVWSPRYIDSAIVRFHDGNGDGDLLDAEDSIRYYTTDANHNVTATIDAATGEVIERYVYTAYGTATVYSPTWTDLAAAATDGPLYCGYFLDAETGLYQVRNRYYDASLSTFSSRDPDGYGAGDLNLYRYVGGHPVDSMDPLGLASWKLVIETTEYEAKNAPLILWPRLPADLEKEGRASLQKKIDKWQNAKRGGTEVIEKIPCPPGTFPLPCLTGPKRPRPEPVVTEETLVLNLYVVRVHNEKNQPILTTYVSEGGLPEGVTKISHGTATVVFKKKVTRDTFEGLCCPIPKAPQPK